MTAYVTQSEEETAAVGRELARHVTIGWTVLLHGPLGAGKTAFVRGLAAGFGCAEDDVSSPTFTIVQEYRGPVGRTLLRHVDLYRLTPVEVDDLGLDEMLDDSVVAVEWPDRWRDAPADAIQITIAITSGTERRITIVGLGAGDASPRHSTR